MPQQDTRERLLEAAAKTIAESGFRDATVRAICRRARANVAAVNYYFGSREGLFRESLRWVHAQLPDLPAPDPAGPPLPPAAVIAMLGNRILGTHEPWQTHLMLRGMLDPQPALDDLVREYLEPRLRVLERAFAAEVPDADPRRLRIAAISVVAQFGWVRLAAPIALRFLGETGPVSALRDEFVSHVARTTLAWLRADPGALRRGSLFLPLLPGLPPAHPPEPASDAAAVPAGSVPEAHDVPPDPPGKARRRAGSAGASKKGPQPSSAKLIPVPAPRSGRRPRSRGERSSR